MRFVAATAIMLMLASCAATPDPPLECPPELGGEETEGGIGGTGHEECPDEEATS